MSCNHELVERLSENCSSPTAAMYAAMSVAVRYTVAVRRSEGKQTTKKNRDTFATGKEFQNIQVGVEILCLVCRATSSRLVVLHCLF